MTQTSPPPGPRRPKQSSTLFFGMLRHQRRPSGGLRLRPVWQRIVPVAGALFIAGWMGLALTAFIFVRYVREVEGARFVDLAFPHRWEEYRRIRGDDLIARAQDAVERADWRVAMHLVRTGVDRSPANIEGRMLLAQLLTAWRRPDLAMNTLDEGLVHGTGSLEYLRLYLSVLLQYQEDERVRSIASNLLSPPPATSEIDQLLALALATAHFHRGNYDQSESVLLEHNLQRSREGQVLQVRIEWERGAREAAIFRLQNLINQFPTQDELYLMMTAFLREMGREAEAERFAILRQINNPLDPGPRLSLLQVFHARGNLARLNREIEALLQDYSRDPRILTQISDYAAKVGDVVLADRVAALSDQLENPPVGPTLLSIEARITARQYDDALRQILALRERNPEWITPYLPTLNGLQAIAYFGSGNENLGDLFLTQYLNSGAFRTENLLAVSGRLEQIGRLQRARRVLDQAYAIDEFNQAALTNLVRLDLQMGNLEQLLPNLRRLLAMRKPSPEVLRLAYRTLSSDLLLFHPAREEILQEIHTSLHQRPALMTRS